GPLRVQPPDEAFDVGGDACPPDRIDGLLGLAPDGRVVMGQAAEDRGKASGIVDLPQPSQCATELVPGGIRQGTLDVRDHLARPAWGGRPARAGGAGMKNRPAPTALYQGRWTTPNFARESRSTASETYSKSSEIPTRPSSSRSASPAMPRSRWCVNRPCPSSG